MRQNTEDAGQEQHVAEKAAEDAAKLLAGKCLREGCDYWAEGSSIAIAYCMRSGFATDPRILCPYCEDPQWPYPPKVSPPLRIPLVGMIPVPQK
jgi:hypothetical protein